MGSKTIVGPELCPAVPNGEVGSGAQWVESGHWQPLSATAKEAMCAGRNNRSWTLILSLKDGAIFFERVFVAC